MKLICPDCGAQYESGKFCLECGAKLQEGAPELVCPSCGYKAKSGKFCPECGTKLTEQTVSPKKPAKKENVKRKFNERDPRFAKYYDKKGFPRTIPQEERDVAIEDLTPFVSQNIAEAKMLLGNILMADKDTAVKASKLIKEAEEAGDKMSYYLMGMLYYFGVDTVVEQNHDEAEKRLLEAYQEYSNGDFASILAELYLNSTEKCDYKKAFEYATIAAEDDDEGGYYVLGLLYQHGWGITKDIQQALENYKMSAAYGNALSMNQLGIIFEGEEGVEKNPEQAFYWFNEAAKKGLDVGMSNLGFCYKDGFGVEADAEKAAEWFKKAAELGYEIAMVQLGGYYQDTLFDVKKAKTWYLKAAELGNAEAQNKLGVIYADIENDYKEAIKWYKKAMEQDYPWAYRNLGLCYRNGTGVKQNLKKAEELLSKASELGVDDASEIKDEILSSKEDEQIDKANSLMDKGEKKEAIKIYKELAEKGNVRAQGNYGTCLLNAWGVKQNLKDGIIWLEKAAKQDNGWACLRLAEAYLGWEYNGKSFPSDIKKAKQYLDKALSLGADPEEVNNLMTITVPSVEISNVKINKDVKVNGVLGFEVVLKIVANALINHKLNFSAYCLWTISPQDKRCTPGISKGNPSDCRYVEHLEPAYPSTVWEEYKFFIPYGEVLNVQAKAEWVLVLKVWDQTNKKPKLLACDEYPFSLSCTTHLFRSNEWYFVQYMKK